MSERFVGARSPVSRSNQPGTAGSLPGPSAHRADCLATVCLDCCRFDKPELRRGRRLSCSVCNFLVVVVLKRRQHLRH